MSPSTFDITTWAAALGADSALFRLDARAECNSTNTQLMQLAESGALSGTVIVADRQTKGRGRRERIWISAPNDSLVFSLLWRFPSMSSAPEALSLVVGLGLQRALSSFGAAVSLKWPNDILCRDKKLAGVLIETQSGDIKSAVIGIGINLRLPPDMPVDIASNAIALDEVLLQVPGREHLLATLLIYLAVILRRYEAEGFPGLRDEWQAQHVFQGSDVRISGSNADVEGVCIGVTERGELLIDTGEGVRRVVSGDVSLRLA